MRASPLLHSRTASLLVVIAGAGGALVGPLTPRAAMRHTAPCMLTLPPPLEELASSASDAIANIPPLDGIDALLVSPLLVPVLGVWALGASASAANATAAKLLADFEVGRTRSANEALKKKLAESEARYDRKMRFWQDKLDRDRKESLEILRRAKGELREKLKATEKKLAAAEAAAARAPPPPPPPPPEPELELVPIEETPDELDVGGVLEQASSAFTAQPAVVKKLPPGAVRLMPGVSADETVMVTGADGLIGRLVVAELLERCPGAKVRACGTSLSALEERLADLVKAPSLELIQWDALVDPFTEAFDGVSAVVWCASSFGRPSTGVPKEEEKEEEADMPQLVKKALSLFRPQPELTDSRLESGGVRRAANAFKASTALLEDDAPRITPKFVLLSSAAVTRPEWNEEQRNSFPEAYGIPIVQLNPEGILNYKLKGERALRESGVPYCIVRPCAVNDEQPAGGRLVLSSGDLATGRICRSDLARILVDVLVQQNALSKTFEIFSLPGLPEEPIESSLALLPADRIDSSPEPDPVAYSVLVQLKPGEKPMAV